ncbi:MAG: hypothetical protein JST01_22465 [Cyanobacteria bacterium SZAS TMP-1]|nr:hypothetical protein [Cyanobacteria bacterium SZAS TMP-1]
MKIDTIPHEQVIALLSPQTDVRIAYAAYVYLATSSNLTYAQRVLEALKQQQELYVSWLAGDSLLSIREIGRSHRTLLNRLTDEQYREAEYNRERLQVGKAQKSDAEARNDNDLLKSAENELRRLENEMKLEDGARIVNEVIYAGLKARLFRQDKWDETDPSQNLRRFLQQLSAALELKILEQNSRVLLAEQQHTQAMKQLFRFKPDLSNQLNSAC